MKLNATLIGLTAGATLALTPQLAQAQNTIAITGGNMTSGTIGATFTIETAQGTGTLTHQVTPTQAACALGCAREVYAVVSGAGSSSTGPVIFSGVPVVLRHSVNSFTSPITGGTFNSTTVVLGVAAQATIDAAIFTPAGITGSLASPDFSDGNFSFDAFSATSGSTFNSLSIQTTSFNIADALTGSEEQEPDLEEIVGEDGPNSSRPQGRAFRPNGMHTRIIPVWTPGLYQ